MTNSPYNSSDRLRVPPSNQPSQDEQEKAARLLTKLTPPQSEYLKYRTMVDSYLYVVGPILEKLGEQPLRSVKLRRSTLFDGLEYMVTYVDDNWLREVAPGCDAASSTMFEHEEVEGFPLQAPPSIFLPESKRRARNDMFRSIVEHEIVHINQVILGTFPKWPTGRRAEDLIENFLDEVTIEYEAGFLQNVR